ncbi:hypothetical protein [Polyangium aurulentum]|uniref:hypothetical protein n=1 Tax=Polyangium aurulentum TaxID=2567896 RepID=UPI0010AE9952|nr:hypothetical protein [Polyangium aurulentum]UQA63294.1 hypothetical protein E8A73_023640 [Polyangium aurulentum]
MNEPREPANPRSAPESDKTPPSAPRDDGAPEGAEAQGPVPMDPRIRAAWREWLAALASDAEAALAASHVYADLSPAARDAWLDALAEDGPELSVPLLAVYAPLLAVESDPVRRERMEEIIANEAAFASGLGRSVRALCGMAPGGSRVVALVEPVYLCFVRVLWCRYLPDEGFAWARHDSLLVDEDAPRSGCVVDGVVLETTPLTPVIEELAHAILAHRRRGGELPPSLHEFAGLFDADLEASDGIL